MEPFIKSPYRASETRDTDVITTRWPSTTPSLLAKHEVLAATHAPEELNEPLFALMRARKTLNDTRIAFALVRRLHAGKRPDVAERISELSLTLAKVADDFPLSIVNND